MNKIVVQAKQQIIQHLETMNVLFGRLKPKDKEIILEYLLRYI